MNYSKAKEKLPNLIKEMEKYFFKKTTPGKCVPMPGALTTLKSLKEKNFLIGVLTGNIKPIGEYKLLNSGLSKYINFGVFGNMALKRSDLVPLALNEAKKINKKSSIEDLAIIGDSVRDIYCAKESGIKVIAVATGKYKKEELLKNKPDLLVNSLLDTKKILDFLLN
ncbi:MAG: HAD hydrolase-like protein [Patescibacteria group bacterium]|nr:HAD hydrolase-like protein [Patescibacteria group bacterium]